MILAKVLAEFGGSFLAILMQFLMVRSNFFRFRASYSAFRNKFFGDFSEQVLRHS